MATQKEQAMELADKLAEIGIYSTYVGGSGARQKGHGFWLRKAENAEMVRNMRLKNWNIQKEWDEFDALCQLCIALKNDNNTENEWFWRFKDAEKLLKEN